MIRKLVLTTLVGLVALATQTAHAEVFDDFAKWRLGNDDIPNKIEGMIVSTSASEHESIERGLLKVAGSSSATPDARRLALKFLQRLATERSVPTLAKLVKEKDFSHYARLSLEQMKDSEAAGAALRDALSSAPDEVKAGIIASLGVRRDTAAASAISRLTTSSNEIIASEALVALGKIGGYEGKRYLERARVSGALKKKQLEGLLLCAETLADSQKASVYSDIHEREESSTHKAAALRGLAEADGGRAASIITPLLKGDDSPMRLVALHVLSWGKHPDLTRAVADSLSSMSGSKQAEVLTALANRGDSSAVGGILKLTTSGSIEVRKAAVAAACRLGDKSNITAILKTMDSKELAEVAAQGIAAMPDPSINDALLKALDDLSLAENALKAVAMRGIPGAGVRILNMAQYGRSASIRKEAWSALITTATVKDMGQMMMALMAINDRDESSHATKCIKEYIKRTTDKAGCFLASAKHYDLANDEAKAFILELAAVAGTEDARKLVLRELKSYNKSTKEKALKTLSAWSNASVADDLLDLAKTSSDLKTKILAQRGFIEVASREGNRGKQVGLYKKVLPDLKRPDEKRLIASKLGKLQDKAAILLLGEMVDDSSVKEEACAAAVGLASSRWHRAPKNEVKAVLEKVLLTTTNKRTKGDADKAVKKYK
jgi:HEAT repeat protein